MFSVYVIGHLYFDAGDVEMVCVLHLPSSAMRSFSAGFFLSHLSVLSIFDDATVILLPSALWYGSQSNDEFWSSASHRAAHEET